MSLSQALNQFAQNLGRYRLNREIRRRTRVVGSFPDGRSALMRVCARYVTSNEWSTRRYLDMSRLGETVREAN